MHPANQMMARRSAVTLAFSIAAILVVPAAVAQGKPCDLHKGTCDGVDLTKLQGKVFEAPEDAEGYAYQLAMLGELPKPSLPSGCQQYAEHPSVVKVRAVTLSMSPIRCLWARARLYAVGPN